MKILFTGCHYFSCSKQLSRQLLLFFCWKSGFKLFKPLRIFLTDKIPLRVFVSAGDAVQKSVVPFFDEKIVRIRVIGIMRALGFGRNKARLAVKVNIAGNASRVRFSTAL